MEHIHGVKEIYTLWVKAQSNTADVRLQTTVMVFQSAYQVVTAPLIMIARAILLMVSMKTP